MGEPLSAPCVEDAPPIVPAQPRASRLLGFYRDRLHSALLSASHLERVVLPGSHVQIEAPCFKVVPVAFVTGIAE